MYTVTIKETKENGRVWISRHRDNPVPRAVQKHFGQSAELFVNKELTGDGTRMFGQIFGCYDGTWSSETGMIYIDVERR